MYIQYIFFARRAGDGNGDGMVRKSPHFRSLEVGIYIHVPLTKKPQ